MSEIENVKRKQVADAKKRLADAVPDAIDTIAELMMDAKAEPVRLQAAKTVLETNADYERLQGEIDAADRKQLVDNEIARLLKEWQRKEIFLDLRKQMPSASPQEIIEMREKVDYVMGSDVEIEEPE